MKLVSFLLILVILPQSVLANDICFNSIEAAKANAAEIKYDRKQIDFLSKKYASCDADRINLSAQRDAQATEVDGLKQDKVQLNTAVQEYKKAYLDTNAALIKERDDNPSRITWLGIGVISTLILGVAGAFAIHK